MLHTSRSSSNYEQFIAVRTAVCKCTHLTQHRGKHCASEVRVGRNPLFYLTTYFYYYYYYGCTAPCWALTNFSVVLGLYIVGNSPWTGDQPVARPLLIRRTTQTQNKRIKYRYSCLE
jgi:hypothetical protein